MVDTKIIRITKDGPYVEYTYESILKQLTPLIQKITYEWKGTKIPYIELHHLCTIGLWKSFKNYNESYNVSFIAYSTICMTNEIRNDHRIKKYKMYDLEVPMNEGFDEYFGDRICLEEDVCNKVLLDEVLEITNTLTDLEKEVVMGLLEKSNLTQQELATKHGVSQARVSRVKTSICGKIRHIYDSKHLNMRGSLYGK